MLLSSHLLPCPSVQSPTDSIQAVTKVTLNHVTVLCWPGLSREGISPSGYSYDWTKKSWELLLDPNLLHTDFPDLVCQWNPVQYSYLNSTHAQAHSKYLNSTVFGARDMKFLSNQERHCTEICKYSVSFCYVLYRKWRVSIASKVIIVLFLLTEKLFLIQLMKEQYRHV